MRINVNALIELPDGRVGRVVYHGLDGYGIKFGRASLTDEEIDHILGHSPMPWFGSDPDPLAPDALLRAPYTGAQCECVGHEFKLIDEGSP